MLLLQPTNLTSHAATARDSNPDLDLLHRSSHPGCCLLHRDDVRKLGSLAVDAFKSSPVNAEHAQVVCDKNKDFYCGECGIDSDVFQGNYRGFNFEEFLTYLDHYWPLCY